MRTTPSTAIGAAAFLLLAGLSAPGQAQDTPGTAAPALVTDRPDQTESPVVVEKGSVQLETGVLLSRDDGGGEGIETFEGPGTLVRIGLGRRTELRLGWGGWVDEVGSGAGGGPSGVADAELGAKVELFAESGARPQAALLASTSLPVGDDALTSDRFDPAFRFSFGHTLTERLSLGYNAGVEWFSEAGPAGGRERFSQGIWTAVLGIGISDRVGAFVEAFGEVPIDGPPGAGETASLDGGFTWLARPNVQLDLAGGVGVTGEAPDWFVGAGLSVRWPR